MDAFFHAYLFAFIYWSQLALGAAGVLMIYRLTGGEWGRDIERWLLSISRTIYAVVLLFIPLAFGVDRIYSWALTPDVRNPEQKYYLNSPFFMGRSVFYLACWILLALFLVRWSERLRQSPHPPAVEARLQALSSGGLVLYGFTVSFASFDWVMSLEPSWSSTIYGLLFWVGQGLSAFALVLFLLPRSDTRPSKKALVDLGNILLAFVMLWAYLAFMQYLVMWSGNKPDEALWYHHRSRGGWQYLATVIAAAQFAAPFVLLLFRGFKANARRLAALGLALLVVRAVDVFWLVMPALRTERAGVSIVDLVVFCGVGLIWCLALYLSDRRTVKNLIGAPRGQK